MKWNARLWKNSVAQFTKFMTPLVATLGRSERRRAATHYVEGLLMPGQRKSIEPMAARVGVDSQSLQQLVTSSPWSDEGVWEAIRHRDVWVPIEPEQFALRVSGVLELLAVRRQRHRRPSWPLAFDGAAMEPDGQRDLHAASRAPQPQGVATSQRE